MNKLSADELVVPRFVERFPEHRGSIVELRFRDAAVNELCHDYDDVVNALEGATSESSAYRPGESIDDLRRLKQELEQELLRRLSGYANAKSR